MKIQFLGTGAADWKGVGPDWPGYRYFSSALIDGVLLIDPGPDVFDSSERYGIDISGVKYIICTHCHADHYSPGTVKKLEAAGAVFAGIKAGETAVLGGYTVKAYAANHGTCDGAVHFLIGRGDKAIYYALDGAWLLYNEVDAIKAGRLLVCGDGAVAGRKTAPGVDLIVLDATIGDVPGDYRIFEHNNLNMVREMKLTLGGACSKYVISHMALTLHGPHGELAEKMLRDGIVAAYDGLSIEI